MKRRRSLMMQGESLMEDLLAKAYIFAFLLANKYAGTMAVQIDLLCPITYVKSRSWFTPRRSLKKRPVYLRRGFSV